MDDVFIEVVLLHLSNWKQNLTRVLKRTSKRGMGRLGAAVLVPPFGSGPFGSRTFWRNSD